MAGPSNRPRLPSSVVDAYRRERIVQATAECAHAVGMESITVSLILRRCRMARKTFYDIFPTKSDALEFSCQAATDFLVGAVRGADQGGSLSTVAVIDSFIEAVEGEPLLAELCLVHSTSAPVPEADRFSAALIQALCEGLGETRFRELFSLMIVQAVKRQLTQGSAADLAEVRDVLIGMTAHSYEL